MPSDVAAWQSMVQKFRKKAVFREAEPIVADLDAAVQAITQILAREGILAVGAVAKGVKGDDRAAEKVATEYGGDWWLIKDLARGTIAIDSARQADAVMQAVIDYCTPSNGWSFHDKKLPRDNPKGYSDWKVFVRRHGNVAEIQVNTKAMLWAKDMSFFMANLKDSAPEMKARFGMVPGGLGHWFYELTRAAGSPHAAAADAAGVAYYDYFRSDPPSMMKGQAARAALAALPPPPLHH